MKSIVVKNSIVSLVGGVALLLTLLLVNGGYIYKTSCPLSSGGTQTNWTYGIDDIVPYVRSTSPPCSDHTGTRLLLSAVGIWPLGKGTAAQTITPSDLAAAGVLEVATSAINLEFAQERTQMAPITRKIDDLGLTAGNRQELVGAIERSVVVFQRIQGALNRPTKASDSQLIMATRDLSTWLGYQIAINQLLLTASSPKNVLATANAEFGTKLTAVIEQLRFLSIGIQARYPNVSAWGFLPAK